MPDTTGNRTIYLVRTTVVSNSTVHSFYADFFPKPDSKKGKFSEVEPSICVNNLQVLNCLGSLTRANWKRANCKRQGAVGTHDTLLGKPIRIEVAVGTVATARCYGVSTETPCPVRYESKSSGFKKREDRIPRKTRGTKGVSAVRVTEASEEANERAICRRQT